MSTDRATRTFWSTVVGGVVVALACWLAFYLVLPPVVPSSDAGAPRGEVQPKFEALSSLLWGVPMVAVLMGLGFFGGTALGPDFLNVHNRRARDHWRSPEHWPEARACILRAGSVSTALACVWLVLVLGIESGAPTWHLGWWRFVTYAVTGLAVLGWLVWQLLRLERVPDRAGQA